MQTYHGRLPRPVQSRAFRLSRAPHHPPAIDVWSAINDAIRDFRAGKIDFAALQAVVRRCLARSAELTVARAISLPDAERINYLGAFALRQSQTHMSALDPGEADASAGAAAPARGRGALSLE
jgi:hypothetical protein